MYSEIYLDNSATTRAFDEVVEYMDFVGRNVYGNPSSLHRKGIEAERLIKKARESISTSLGVENREVYFTSGGTESNNLAIRGFLSANPRRGSHIITTKIEHPSVLEVFKNLSEKGYSIDFIDVDSNGVLDIGCLKSKIRKDTALLSIIFVNNEIGTIQPIEEIIKVKNSINRDIAIHVDAVQAYGKIKILPKKLGIDMLSVSSHKIHGPKGVGALYVSKNIKIKPIIYGGGQESLLRSGTENVPGICGFGKATEMVQEELENNYSNICELKKIFIESLQSEIEGYEVISPDNALPYIINISFSNVKAEVLLHHLEERNIYVSTGSACSSKKNAHSHVLKSIGLKPSSIEGAVRFSLSSFNTEDDVLQTVKVLKEILPVIQIRKNRGVRR